MIRSSYRAHSRFLKATFDKGNKCAKCDWMLVRGRTSLKRPELCATPCYGCDEHLGRSVLDICRHCNTHLKVLACVVCNKEIAPPDVTADEGDRMALRCFANCHETCQEQLFQRRQCVVPCGTHHK